MAWTQSPAPHRCYGNRRGGGTGSTDRQRRGGRAADAGHRQLVRWTKAKGDMNTNSRRWFQFSLRTLLIGMTLICVACGLWLGPKARRHSLVMAIEAAGG